MTPCSRVIHRRRPPKSDCTCHCQLQLARLVTRDDDGYFVMAGILDEPSAIRTRLTDQHWNKPCRQLEGDHVPNAAKPQAGVYDGLPVRRCWRPTDWKSVVQKMRAQCAEVTKKGSTLIRCFREVADFEFFPARFDCSSNTFGANLSSARRAAVDSPRRAPWGAFPIHRLAL
jgi:hypothetical protein